MTYGPITDHAPNILGSVAFILCMYIWNLNIDDIGANALPSTDAAMPSAVVSPRGIHSRSFDHSGTSLN